MVMNNKLENFGGVTKKGRRSVFDTMNCLIFEKME